MPLTVAPVGKEVRITKLLLEDSTKRHLESLGVMIDQAITLVSDNRGDLIIQVKNSRLAINKALAMKIFVK